ncbi:MAG: NADP-dependent oxidoreductase [Novosphingobium sp.]
MKSREIHLASRPVGAIVPENFSMATVDVAAPKDGEVLIKNLWMSIDAGQRTLMGSGDADLADLPPKRFELDEPMEGQVIGQVIESRKDSLPVGTFVVTNFSWREYFTHGGEPDGFTLRILENPQEPLQAYLHIRSIYGATAYFHVLDGAKVKAGETVWVSTAAGITGSIACQIAKMRGAKVIGTTGSDTKVDWLKNELKIDDAFNYNQSGFADQIRQACPEGIDVFLDFAGGDQLEVAIDLMKPRGRIIKIGETSTYDGSEPVGPRNMFQIILKRLDLLGRSIFDYLPQADTMAKAYADIDQWYGEGKLRAEETVYFGIENAVQAQIDLFAGKNLGKMLVKLGDPMESN